MKIENIKKNNIYKMVMPPKGYKKISNDIKAQIGDLYLNPLNFQWSYIGENSIYIGEKATSFDYIVTKREETED